MIDPSTTVLIEDARIILKNFTGREGQMNAAGDRNFCVVLDPEMGATMKADGWNVRPGKDDPDGNTRDPFLSVSVRFGARPPKVVMITSRGRTDLTEDMVEMLDWSNFKTVDLIFRPYNWEMSGGRHGVKAYLVSLFVTIEEDALDLKYADVPDAGEAQYGPGNPPPEDA